MFEEEGVDNIFSSTRDYRYICILIIYWF